METVNKILVREVPATNGMPVALPEKDTNSFAPEKEAVKKIVLTVNSLTEVEHQRRHLIEQIQFLDKSGSFL